MSILIVAELRDGEVRSSNYPVIAAAKALSAINGASYDILALGKDAAAGAETLKGFGDANVFYSEADVVADYTAEAYAAATAAVCAEKGATVIMAAATTTGKDMMPRLAGLIGAGMVSDVIGFEADGYLRPMYAGNAIGKIAVDTDVAVMTVREGLASRQIA